MIAMHMVGPWGFGLFGLLVPLALVGTLVGLVVWAVRGAPGRPDQGALRIIEERFARGEIDVEEFESRRRVLQG
ncbi:MAG: SHOCT domain-containing protein [Acidimicrobiia bacterium]